MKVLIYLNATVQCGSNEQICWFDKENRVLSCGIS